jgi:hypothetical protein
VGARLAGAPPAPPPHALEPRPRAGAPHAGAPRVRGAGGPEAARTALYQQAGLGHAPHLYTIACHFLPGPPAGPRPPRGSGGQPRAPDPPAGVLTAPPGARSRPSSPASRTVAGGRPPFRPGPVPEVSTPDPHPTPLFVEPQPPKAGPPCPPRARAAHLPRGGQRPPPGRTAPRRQPLLCVLWRGLPRRRSLPDRAPTSRRPFSRAAARLERVKTWRCGFEGVGGVCGGGGRAGAGRGGAPAVRMPAARAACGLPAFPPPRAHGNAHALNQPSSTIPTSTTTPRGPPHQRPTRSPPRPAPAHTRPCGRRGPPQRSSACAQAPAAPQRPARAIACAPRTNGARACGGTRARGLERRCLRRRRGRPRRAAAVARGQPRARRPRQRGQRAECPRHGAAARGRRRRGGGHIPCLRLQPGEGHPRRRHDGVPAGARGL